MVPDRIECKLHRPPNASTRHQSHKDHGRRSLCLCVVSHRAEPEPEGVLGLEHYEPLNDLLDISPRAAGVQGLLARHQLHLEPLGKQLHVYDLADVPELDGPALLCVECACEHPAGAETLLLHGSPLGVLLRARQRARLRGLRLLLQQDGVLDHLRHALVREAVVEGLLELACPPVPPEAPAR
jgi:hypothetical protein